MTALAADRNTPERTGHVFETGVAASTKVYGGGIACLNSSGYLVPGAATAGLRTVGMFNAFVDNSGGADGAVNARVMKGVFRFNNSASADLIALANVGQKCYVVDDNTVALTDNGAARPVAGEIVDVDSNGVWVALGTTPNLTAEASLNFPSIGAAAQADLTIAVPGAKANDLVTLGLPTVPIAGLVFNAFVSAPDTVTVRATNVTGSGVDESALTFRVAVIRQ